MNRRNKEMSRTQYARTKNYRNPPERLKEIRRRGLDTDIVDRVYHEIVEHYELMTVYSLSMFAGPLATSYIIREEDRDFVPFCKIDKQYAVLNSFCGTDYQNLVVQYRGEPNYFEVQYVDSNTTIPLAVVKVVEDSNDPYVFREDMEQIYNKVQLSDGSQVMVIDGQPWDATEVPIIHTTGNKAYEYITPVYPYHDRLFTQVTHEPDMRLTLTKFIGDWLEQAVNPWDVPNEFDILLYLSQHYRPENVVYIIPRYEGSKAPYIKVGNLGVTFTPHKGAGLDPEPDPLKIFRMSQYEEYVE